MINNPFYNLTNLNSTKFIEDEQNNLFQCEFNSIMNAHSNSNPNLELILSEEQNSIINTNSNLSIIVDAVAGSGKTTTILHKTMNEPEKNIFQITYNNLLRKEVRQKIYKLNIKNIEVHTYHSLAVKYYNKYAYTDDGIKKILIDNSPIVPIQNSNTSTNTNIKPIDILFIDETQDMMLDYFKLIKKFITDTKSNPQIILLGDKYQSIYDFKGANSKFLTLGDKIWPNSNQFIKLNLTLSYRLTEQIGWFINNVMLNFNRITTNKSGPPVDYYLSNPFKIYKKIGQYLVKNILNNNFLPSDIFILVPSVKSSNAPYKKLENYLVKKKINCITSASDESKLDEKIISNKIVFTTFHQAKGRERKIVVVYNFDESFTNFFNKSKNQINQINQTNQIKCPNILYVGVTRASYKLILIHDVQNKPLEFLNLNKLQTNEFVNLYSDKKNNFVKKNKFICSNLINENIQIDNKDNIKKFSVSEIAKYLSHNTLNILIELVDNLFIQIIKPDCSNKQVQIPNKIEIKSNNIRKKNHNHNHNDNQNETIWEDVSDLNGIVIPAILESKLIGNISTIEQFVQYKQTNVEIWNSITQYVKNVKIPARTINDYLKIGNIYQSLNNNLHAKISQIRKYNWLNEHMINYSHSKMNMITFDTQFEIVISSPNSNTDYYEYSHNLFGKIHFKGRLDAMNTQGVWEFKCVDLLTIEHKLQLIIYYWLCVKTNMTSVTKPFYLLNIKSGELLKLNVENFHQIEHIVEIILQNKFFDLDSLNDNEFIKNCLEK